MERLADLATLEELRHLADGRRATKAADDAALARRDAAIAAAFEVGVSPTSMARVMRLDRQIVYRIARRDARG